MAKVIFQNLSMDDAILFARWYENQGEQSADEWFDINGSRAPLADVQRKGGYKEVNKEKEEVTVFLK